MTFTRCCTKCARSLPLAEFMLRRDRGEGARLSQCRQCYRDRRRTYQSRRTVKAPSQTERLWARDRREVECDQAFSQWRAVGGVAFQGARL